MAGVDLPTWGSTTPTVSQNAPSGGGGVNLPSWGGNGSIVGSSPPAHHGLLGTIVNDVGLGGAAHEIHKIGGQTLHDAESLLINGPAGLVHLVEHPIAGAKALGTGVVQDFKHPLRHPLYTLLDLSNIVDLGAGAVGRVAEAGRIAERAGAPAVELTDAATAAKLGRTQEYNRAINPHTESPVPVGKQISTALLKGIPRQQRVIKLETGLPNDFLPRVIGDYSKGFTVRQAQKLVDRAHERFPNANIPVVFNSQAARAGKALRYQNIYQENLIRRPAAALARAAKGLSKPEQVAIRVVGEGASIPERIAYHENQIATAGLSNRLVKESQAEIELLKKAEQYITMGEVGGISTGKVYYRGERANGMSDTFGEKAGVPGLDKNLWVSADRKAAEDYGLVDVNGGTVRELHALSTARIYKVSKDELNREISASGGLGAHARAMHAIVERARERGFDAVEFPDQYRDGTAVLNENAFSSVAGSGRLTPLIKPEFEKLQNVVDMSRNVASARERLLGSVLHSPNAINRKLGPLRVIRGEALPEIPEKVQNELTYLKSLDKGTVIDEKTGQIINRGTHADKIEEAQARLEAAKKLEENPATLGGQPVSEEYLNHLIRIPYQTHQGLRSLLGPRRFQGGRVPPPSTVTHAFTAGYLKHGVGRNDAANLIAESYTEAARYHILNQARHDILPLLRDSPQQLIDEGVKPKYIIAVNKDILSRGPGASDAMRQWRAGGLDEKEFANLDEAQAVGSRYDALRQELFKDMNDALANNPNYGFVDRRLLGGLDEQNPLSSITSREGGRGGLRVVDAINNAVKAAILYLKPAYLFPNWLGNVALGFIHQGFAAPLNLYKAARLEHKIGSEAVSAIDVGMGGGHVDVLAPQGSKLTAITEKSNKLGNFYGKLIDDPSRRAAFYHEAGLHGFTTPEQVKALATEAKFTDEFSTILQRASQEIIDYQRLSPVEQSIIRRVIFFYPWVKGSSRYAAHFFANHPAASLLNTQASKQGEEWQKEVFGKLPAYAEGLIPFFGKKNNGNPYAINPSSASILGTPGDVLESLGNLLTNKPNADLNLVQNVAPFDASVLSLALGKPVTGPNKGGSPLGGAAGQLYGGLPLTTLIQGLLQQGGVDKPGRVYPAAQGNIGGIPIQDLILLSRFGLFGGLTSRPYSPISGQASAYRETNPIP